MKLTQPATASPVADYLASPARLEVSGAGEGIHQFANPTARWHNVGRDTELLLKILHVVQSRSCDGGTVPNHVMVRTPLTLDFNLVPIAANTSI